MSIKPLECSIWAKNFIIAISTSGSKRGIAPEPYLSFVVFSIKRDWNI